MKRGVEKMIIRKLDYEAYKGQKYQTEIVSDRYLSIEPSDESFDICWVMSGEPLRMSINDVMLEDWQKMTQDFEQKLVGQSAEAVAAELFSLIHTFTLRYDPAWREYEQQGGSRSMIGKYHGTLAEQFTGYIREALPSEQQEREPYLAGFLAEILIRFGSDASIEYGMIAPAVRKLLSNQSSALSLTGGN